MSEEGTGHDWFHIQRVVREAKLIARKEGGDLFVIELAALLHDIGDWKFHEGDSKVGSRKAQEWLGKMKVDKQIIEDVCFIVEHISYKGGTNKVRMKSLEGKIVQDADRLDALGAIGIARIFAFGGMKGREIYNPKVKPFKHKTFGNFKKRMSSNTSLNHFYEKVLLLKNKMNTKTGKRTAQQRHDFVKAYLKQFLKEWNR